MVIRREAPLNSSYGGAALRGSDSIPPLEARRSGERKVSTSPILRHHRTTNARTTQNLTMTDHPTLPEPTGGATFAAYGADDHEAEATIRTAIAPDSPRTVESLRHDDATWDDSAHWRARAIPPTEAQATARDTATGAPVASVRLAHMPWPRYT